MSLPVTTGRGKSQGRLERQSLYDREGVKTAVAVSNITLFSNAYGSQDSSGMITSKQYGDTNVNQSGQLSAGQEMTVDSLYIRITPALYAGSTLSAPTAASPATITESDLLTLYFRSWVTFSISGIIMYQAPLEEVASGTGILFSGNTTADARSLYTNGNGHPTSVNSVQSKFYEWGRMTIPGGQEVPLNYAGPSQTQKFPKKTYAAFPTIDQNENFQVSIQWPSAITLVGSVLISAYLGGLFLRPM